MKIQPSKFIIYLILLRTSHIAHFSSQRLFQAQPYCYTYAYLTISFIYLYINDEMPMIKYSMYKLVSLSFKTIGTMNLTSLVVLLSAGVAQ